ncbi:MAG: tetratricopeptide repeat protein [Cyclobacteriaceae bacterium]|nr:tetratricopeptide repeat protein [Cyclobacteriaceae bacterium]
MRIALLFVFLSSSLFAQTVDRAKELWENKNSAEAKRLLTTVKKDNKEFAAAQYYLGRIAFDEKDYDAAEDYFEEAIDVNDKVAEYHTWYGNTLGTMAADANLFKQAMLGPKMKNAWEKAVQLDPKSVDARESLIQYYLQAPAIAGGSVDKAKEIANEIIKLKPAEGHRQLGNIYYKEKNLPEAEKEFIAMAKADPAYASGLANYYINQKQYDKAFALFEDELKKNPEDMLSTYQIGKTSALSGQRLERGEACLRKYLTYQPQKNEPSHAGANMRLAQIMEKGGKKSEAKKLYETALKADATLKEAKEGLERVSK